MPPLLPQPSTDCSAHQVVWGPHIDPLFSSQHCAAPVAEVPAQEDCAIVTAFWQTVIANHLCRLGLYTSALQSSSLALPHDLH